MEYLGYFQEYLCATQKEKNILQNDQNSSKVWIILHITVAHLISSLYFQHSTNQSILASKRMAKLISKYTCDEYDYPSNVSRILNFRQF